MTGVGVGINKKRLAVCAQLTFVWRGEENGESTQLHNRQNPREDDCHCVGQLEYDLKAFNCMATIINGTMGIPLRR